MTRFPFASERVHDGQDRPTHCTEHPRLAGGCLVWIMQPQGGLLQQPSSASAGAMLPIGPRSRRQWLNQSTHSTVATSTASSECHSPHRRRVAVVTSPRVTTVPTHTTTTQCDRIFRRNAEHRHIAWRAIRAVASKTRAWQKPIYRPQDHSARLAARAQTAENIAEKCPCTSIPGRGSYGVRIILRVVADRYLDTLGESGASNIGKSVGGGAGQAGRVRALT
jgi:hypothetical protein